MANINKRANKETDLHVDSHFSRLLISLLNRYHSIELKDIGTLSLLRDEAKLDETTNLITPPKNILKLERTDLTRGTTVLEAYETGLINLADYNGLKRFMADVLAKISKHESFDIPYIGSFTSVNGLITLQEKNPKSTGSLKELQLTIRDSPLIESSSDDFVTSEDSESTKEVLNVMETQKVMDTEKVGHVESEVASVKSKKEKPYVSRKSSVGSVVKILPESPWYHHLIPLLLLISGVVALVSVFRYCNDQKVRTEQLTEMKPLERMQDDVDPLAYSDSTKLFDHPHLDRYRNVLTQAVIDDGCKIAVGSFKKRENAVNMMERIFTEGYDAAIIESEKGSRVVIKFDCLEHDLIDYLKSIRREIAENAWYYQPRYEPDL